MQLTVWNPARIVDEFDHMLDSFFGGRADPVYTRTPVVWMPRVDITEDDDAYHLVFELPGMTEDQVEVSLEDGFLRVSGRVEASDKENGVTYHRMERRVGSFERSFRLPVGLNLDKASARMKNGLLEVTLPKSDASKPRKLTIRRK